MNDKKTESTKSYDTIKLGIDAHSKWYYAARQLEGATPQDWRFANKQTRGLQAVLVGSPATPPRGRKTFVESRRQPHVILIALGGSDGIFCIALFHPFTSMQMVLRELHEKSPGRGQGAFKSLACE